MKILLTALMIVLSVLSAKSQSDTTTKYYWRNWKECAKDTAVYISKLYRQDNVWKRKSYYLNGMKTEADETWLDENCTKPYGTSTWYSDSGVIIKTQDYVNEKTSKTNYFFSNGNKKAVLMYDPVGQIVQQTGWEINGIEIPNYIYEKEAHFPGGPKAWMQYLISQINPNTAARAKAPKGIYTVKLQFIVNKEGKVERAEAISVPDACRKCGDEAVSIITKSPKWENAIQYGHAVIYQCIQYVSWQVED